MEAEDVPMFRVAVDWFLRTAPTSLIMQSGGLQNWDILAAALTRSDPATTLAQRFCAHPEASAYAEPYNATQTYGEDATAELRFPDGSFASQVDGGGWEPTQLREDAKLAKFDDMDCRPLPEPARDEWAGRDPRELLRS